jgi:two-component system NarL family sensor kinase
MEWVTLAARAGSTDATDGPVRMRRVVAQVAAAAVVIVCLVGVAGSIISRRIAERQSVHDVAQMTDVLAESVFQPALTDAMLTDPAVTRTVLDPVVHSMLNTLLVRIKLWTPAGVVMYSDEARLIGQTFLLEPEARTALTSPRTEASISDLRRPENQFERSQGKLLEVYRPVWTPSGEPLLFETYFRYDTVRARSHELWRGFSGIMLSSLAAAFVLLLPLVWTLLERTRRMRAQREEMMRRALDASLDERRRIAASLHDGVVQQLAAASFAAAGQAERAAAGGDAPLAAGLHETAATIRAGMAGLRALLVDIYPPSLRTSGLAAALRDLASTTSGRGAEVDVDIDEHAADALPEAAQDAVFRVAQECLRNAIRHSGAAHIGLRLAVADQVVRVEIVDDGAGFDAAATMRHGPEGHFGLRLMRDVAERCGCELAIASAPGEGTRIRMDVPRS